MGSTDAFIRAAVSRIGARLGHGLADAAAELAVLAQDAPDRLRQEWELFQEEVRAEAERLENGESNPSTADPTAVPDATAVRDATAVPDPTAVSDPAAVTDTTGVVTQPTARTPQEMVDHLRASVAELNRMLEARS